MAHKIGSKKDDASVVDPTAARLWTGMSAEIESIAQEAQRAIKWRRAHPGTTAHLKMARKTAQQQAANTMETLRTLLLEEAPSHWDVADWGFSVGANMRDLRWDQKMGKGRASWSNHVYGNSAADIAAFAGRVFAAFAIARAANTEGQTPTLFRFALPETHSARLGPGIETTWHFRNNPVLGRGADDAFAYGSFIGAFPKHPPDVLPEATFHAAYQFVLDQHALAVASHTPTLIDRLLTHPKAKLLMAAQFEPNDSRDLKLFQHVLRQRHVLEANPTISTRLQATQAGKAMETFLDGVLELLDGVGRPSMKDKRPKSWKVWSAQGKGNYKRVWAWNAASACAIAAIDDLQMVKDVRNLAHYASMMQPGM